MKKINLFMATLITATTIGCSKNAHEDGLLPRNAPGMETSSVDSRSAEIDRQTTGWVTGTVMPANEPHSVMLMNGTNSYGPYPTEMRTGYFVFKGVEPGSYKLIISRVADDAQDDASGMTVGVVQVEAGQVTNAGTIHF